MKTTPSKKQVNPRDGLLTSAWQKFQFDRMLPSPMPAENNLFDVLIVGGGITGLTTALLLQQQGRKCLLAESHNLGFGTTGGTSAHLNTFFDATYADIEKDFGEDAARLVARSGKEVMELIRTLTDTHGIDCDLEAQPGYLFAQDEKEEKELDELCQASLRAGIAVEETRQIPLPVPFSKAYVFQEQGQFHPLAYLYGLAGAFLQLGGTILEQTLVHEATYGKGQHSVQTSRGAINAKEVVYATHIPPGINKFHFSCAPYRSYVLGIRVGEDEYPAGLAYDMQDPYHYFRTHVIGGKKYLILGGEDHKSGHGDPEQAFRSLEEYARKYFKVEEVKYRWSSQYYIPADGLPYIGPHPNQEHAWVATGYNGNGMIFGTLAGKMISDGICGRTNGYEKLYSPSRIKFTASIKEMVKENADVVWHFIADRLSGEELKTLMQLPRNTGKIVDYHNYQLAVYRDEQGNFHALKPVCTHAGCIVQFNPAEKTWDCPCHGGRFDIHGQVLTGPPGTNLEKISLDYSGV